MRILLVEDEPELGATLRARLTHAGYVVDLACSLGDAIEAVMLGRHAVVLLDRRLPDGDGLALLPVLRTRNPAPQAIVLTALDDIADRVKGLDAGAVDYLVKPFSFDELAARLRAVSRRTYSSAPLLVIEVGCLQFDPATRDVSVNGRHLLVPRRELAILGTLLRRAGRVVVREHLESEVYGFDDEIGSNAIEAQVSRLRRRLADAQAGVALIGVRGVGYLLKAG
jgi:DNA-binding response OmpR family regulator